MNKRHPYQEEIDKQYGLYGTRKGIYQVLITAIWECRPIEEINRMLNNGVIKGSLWSDVFNVLWAAVERVNEEALIALIKYGININRRDYWDVARCNRQNMIEFVLRRPVALMRKRQYSIALLLKHGATFNVDEAIIHGCDLSFYRLTQLFVILCSPEHRTRKQKLPLSIDLLRLLYSYIK